MLKCKTIIACVLSVVPLAVTINSSSAQNAGSYHLAENNVIVKKIADSNSWAAYSSQTGKWLVHKFPDGVKVTPVQAGNCTAFGLTGEKVLAIVAVDSEGKWHSHALQEKGVTNCNPSIGRNLAVYSINGVVYAFSSLKGTWASTPSTETPELRDDFIMLVSKDRINAYSAHTGTWAKSPKVAPAE
jgi:hypothetical protein